MSDEPHRRKDDDLPEKVVLLRWIRRLLVGGMVGIVLVTAILLTLDYKGRTRQRDTNVARCIVSTSNNLANIRATLQAAVGSERRGLPQDGAIYREAAAWLADSSGITPADVNLTDPLLIVQRFTRAKRAAYCEKSRPKEPFISVDF